jgi:hypothetical protein
LRLVARVAGAGGEVTAPLSGSGMDKFRPPFLENFVICIRKARSAAGHALSPIPGVALQLAGFAGLTKR